MERSAKYVLHGAALATLLLGAQSSTAQPVIHHEITFDQYGRVEGVPASLTPEPGDDDWPGSLPNYKC